MQSKTRRRLAMLALPLSIAVFAAACGGDDDDETDTGDEQEASTVQVSGSSTVAPISTLVGEEFMLENDAEVTVDGPGTGDGFELFCDDQIDISDASRPINEEEIAACEATGIEYVEIKVAFDGMAVMTSPNNTAVECLSFADLYALIGPESEGFAKWSDGAAIAGELGSTTQLPDVDLELTGPGTESGTYDSFVEIAFGDIAEERGQEETTRTDYSASPDDNVIVSNIEASDTSLGWVGFAYAEEAGDAVQELAVSEGPDGDCVEPSAETIAEGTYPLSRSLYIYVNKAKAESNPAVVDYVDFYLSDLATWAEEAGYIAIPDDQAEESATAWENR